MSNRVLAEWLAALPLAEEVGALDRLILQRHDDNLVPPHEWAAIHPGALDVVSQAQWLFGTGAPDGGQGVDGQFYLDLTTGEVYLKQSGTWSLTELAGGAGGPSLGIVPLSAFVGTADGTTDNTAAIQAAIDAAPEGGTVLGQPGAHYLWTNLVIEKSLTLDFGGARATVDPTTSGVNGDPAIWGKGAHGTERALGANATTGALTVTVSVGAADFAPGDYVIIRDDAAVAGWSAEQPGYTGRIEINSVAARDGSTLTLGAPLINDYTTAASGRVARLISPPTIRVRNIRHLTEVDPGGTYGGAFIGAAPHLIHFEYCFTAVAENIHVDGYQLHAVNVHRSVNPLIRGCSFAGGFRPTEGGHAYGVTFHSTLGGVALANHGLRIRHLIDSQRSYNTFSAFNTDLQTFSASYLTHGRNTVAWSSYCDASIGQSGTDRYGFRLGNLLANADRRLALINPRVEGVSVAAEIISRTEDVTIVNPLFRPTQVGIKYAGGARRLKVTGGQIDLRGRLESSSYGVLVRDKIFLSHDLGEHPVDLEIDGTTIFAPDQNNAVWANMLGTLKLNEVTVVSQSGVTSAVDIGSVQPPARVIVQNSDFSGVCERQLFVRPGVTGFIHVTGNAFRDHTNPAMNIAPIDAMIITNNRLPLAAHLSFASDIIPHLEAGALVFGNGPVAQGGTAYKLLGLDTSGRTAVFDPGVGNGGGGGGNGASAAVDVSFDPTTSGFTATNVQALGVEIWGIIDEDVLKAVADDPEPKLGGNLDGGGHAIHGYSVRIIDNAATTYTLDHEDGGDSGTVQRFTSESSVSVTAPRTAPRGFVVELLQGGGGNVALEFEAGATHQLHAGVLNTVSAGGRISLQVEHNADGDSAHYTVVGAGTPGTVGAASQISFDPTATGFTAVQLQELGEEIWAYVSTIEPGAPEPSGPQVSGGTHTLTAEQQAHRGVMLHAASSSAIIVPKAAAISAAKHAWLVWVGANDLVLTVAVEDDAGSVNGVAEATVTLPPRRGTLVRIVVETNAGTAPHVFVDPSTQTRVADGHLDMNHHTLWRYRQFKDTHSGAHPLEPADAAKVLVYTGSGHTWTVPSPMAVSNVGQTVRARIINRGTGAITLSADGVTLIGPPVIPVGQTVDLEWESDGTTVFCRVHHQSGPGAELGGYGETSPSASVSGAVTRSFLDGNVHRLTLTGTVTSLTIGNPPAAGIVGTITLILTQDGTGGRAWANPSNTTFIGGSPDFNTAAGAVSVVTYMTSDGGTNWLGFFGGASA